MMLCIRLTLKTKLGFERLEFVKDPPPLLLLQYNPKMQKNQIKVRTIYIIQTLFFFQRPKITQTNNKK